VPIESLEPRRFLSGDFNQDGFDNTLDFNAVAANFARPGPKTFAQGDANGDKTVDTTDFNELAAEFGGLTVWPGRSIASAIPIPGQTVYIEPGTYGPFTPPRSGVAGSPVYYKFKAGAIVDAAGAARAMDRGSIQYIDMTGLVARGARNLIQSPAVLIGAWWTLRDSIIERNDGPGIGFGSNSSMIGGELRFNGQCGFLSAANTAVLIQGVKIHDNDMGLPNPIWINQQVGTYHPQVLHNGLWYVSPYFEAGGGKFSNSTDCVVDEIESYNNIGGNLSWDINNVGAVTRNSYFHDPGVLSGYMTGNMSFELATSGSCLIENNRFDQSSGQNGIAVIACSNVTITGNVFNGGIGVLLHNDDSRAGLKNIFVQNNAFHSSTITTWGNLFPLVNVVTTPNTFQ
jgi:hypothetical protein